MNRKSFSIGITAAVILALGSCTSQPIATQNGDKHQASGKKTLIMASDANYPPYGFYQTSGAGEPIGFDIDIARYVTAQLGYDLKVAPMDFNGIIPALQAKRADFAMAGITPTAERQQNVDFSQTYYTAKNTIVSTQRSTIKTPQNLANKRVGVQLGTTQEQTARKIAASLPGMQIQALNEMGTVIQEIKANRLDAGLMEETAAKGYTSSNPEITYVPIDLDPQGNAIAFPKGSALVPEFDRVLRNMQATGELQKLEKKWFDDYYQNQAKTRK